MPKVFISYSHDSEMHKQDIRQLSERLRNDGVDCLIDQYEPAPNEGWPQWMVRNIRDSEYVILVCTESYQKRVEGSEEDGKGLGVRWEGMHILNTIYKNECKNTKFIPIVLRSEDKVFVPDAVFGWSLFDLSKNSEYIKLNKLLWGELAVTKPQLGKKKDFGDQNGNIFIEESDKASLNQISKILSSKKIYDLNPSEVEEVYSQLEAVNSILSVGFANYLWVILYHEFSKRHLASKGKEGISRKRTAKAMRYRLSKEEKKLVDGINFQTGIKHQLQLLGATK